MRLERWVELEAQRQDFTVIGGPYRTPSRKMASSYPFGQSVNKYILTMYHMTGTIRSWHMHTLEYRGQRRQWHPTPVLLPGQSHGWRSLVGCSPWGCKSQTWLGSHVTFTFHFHALEKEMATHSSVLAWRIPGTGKPGGLPSMGSHRVGHDWSNLAAAAEYEGRQEAILCVSVVCSRIHPAPLDYKRGTWMRGWYT